MARTLASVFARVLPRPEDLPHHHPPLDPQGIRQDLRGVVPQVPLRGTYSPRPSVRGHILRHAHDHGHVPYHRVPADGPRDDDRSLRHTPREGNLFKKASERDGLRR